MLRSFLTPNFRKGLSSTLTATCWNSSCSAAASRLQNQELTSWPGWASHHHYHHQQQSQHISTPSPVSLVIVSPRLFDFGRRAFHTRALQRQRSSKNKKTPSKLQKSLNKVVVPNEEAPLAKRFLYVLTATCWNSSCSAAASRFRFFEIKIFSKRIDKKSFCVRD
jgi:hypothetical protein